MNKEKAKANLEAAEIISKYILKTKDIKTIDLLEEIQKEILNNLE